MRLHLKRFISLLVCTLLCTAFQAVLSLASYGQSRQSENADKTLTILHTNDIHERLRPFSVPVPVDETGPFGRLRYFKDIGGFARLVGLAKQIIAQNSKSTILVDAGDRNDGSAFSFEFKGEAVVEAMSKAPYFVGCPGNHEYNTSLQQVKKMRDHTGWPLVCANSDITATHESLYKKFIIRNVNGIRVAFFGLMTEDVKHGTYPASHELTINAPIEVARKLVPQLRKKADIVVAITHIGVDEDRKLAAQVPGIDVIVGGHSHTYLFPPLLIQHPNDIRPNSVHGTVIVQDFCFGATLGKLDLTLHQQPNGIWTVSKYNDQLLPVTKSAPEDPTVAEVVQRYWSQIKSRYAKELGTATDDFDERGEDNASYNLVADAVRNNLGVVFDLEQRGGVRAPLNKGPITDEDLVTIDPFLNTIVTFNITGAKLREILKRDKPYVSGIQYRLVNSNFGTDLVEANIGRQPIKADTIYSGATNSYFADIINDSITNINDTGTLRRQNTIDYLNTRKSVSPLYDGRRKIEMDPHVYAIWLTSEKDDPFLVSTINGLAQIYGTKSFQPHVTVCTGTLDGSTDSWNQLKARVDALASRTQAIPMAAFKVDHTAADFQYLFVKLIDTSGLLDKVQGILPEATLPDPAIGFHTSLLYNVYVNNNIPHPAIDQVALQLQIFPILPPQFTFDTLKVVIPDSKQFDNAIEGWKTKYEVKLKPLHLERPINLDRLFHVVQAGGQTGVDQSALLAALVSNVLIGGWCPPNRLCQTVDGDCSIPTRFSLVATPVERSNKRPDVARSLRTEWNVLDSQGTLFVKPEGASPKWPEDATNDLGTKWTLDVVRMYHRPYYVIDVSDQTTFDKQLADVAKWARDNHIAVLNVAGPGEKTSPQTGEKAFRFLVKLFNIPR